MAEVLVLVDHANGEVKKPAAEMLTIARRLGEPSAVFIGPGAETAKDLLARYGAEKILAADVLSRATTDPAFQELRDWVTSADAHAELIERRSRPKTITHPKLARPAGRANDNPYAITR